ncbi:hypothetical protein JD844_013960 [Phrynosoma platyrhinos]|uniref:Homeobox domain-containing protein n=1 Tax=Phrynosoma platyrhinos TaxID=52577 RepID=A0ABQ7TLI1_PHRPL|nr:hypothetical protein JD844_013960 [Phrynosoma platyrhinos]
MFHTAIIADNSQKNLEKERETGIIAKEEEEGDGSCYIDKETESLAAPLPTLDPHQLCYPSLGKHLPTCFTHLDTRPPLGEVEQNHTNQPKSQGQANLNATEKETMKKQSNSIFGVSALEDGDIADQIQDQDQNLSLDQKPDKPVRCAAVNYTDLQSDKCLSFPTFEGNPDATRKKESSPETPEEPVPPARKKTRTFYSPEQLDELERMFQEDHYPDNEKRQEIAAAVGVTPQRVMVWFQNRRAKWRKMEKLTAKDNKKPSATDAALLVGPQQNSQGATLLPVPQLPENVHGQPPTILMGPPTINCSSIHSEQSTPLVSTSVASVSSRSAPHESAQVKDISQGIFGSLKEEILQAIPSPPPIRRAVLPCNVVVNSSNPIVQWMLDTSSSAYSPASQESNSSEAFPCSIQSQRVISPVHCNYPEQLEPTANLESQYYHSSSQSGMFQLSQHPQHQMSPLRCFPVHPRAPTVQLIPATPSKSSTPFFSLPGNGELVRFGTTETPPGYLQNHMGGHLLIQPPAGSSGYIPAFQTLPWNDFCLQRAPLTNQPGSQMPFSSSEGGNYSAEQEPFTQHQGVPPISCHLQLPKATVSGSTVLFTASQMTPGDQDLSPAHQSQAEHMTPYEKVHNTDDISRDQVNAAGE